MSGRFAGVGEVLTELAVAVINFEGRSLELNNPITVDELDLRRFPSHISFLLRISKAAARARRHTIAFFAPESPRRLAPAMFIRSLVSGTINAVRRSDQNGFVTTNAMIAESPRIIAVRTVAKPAIDEAGGLRRPEIIL
jgi:hypothetical protein